MMTTRLQIPITTGVAGSSILVVNPMAAFQNLFTAGTYYLPFAATNAASPNNPYLSPTSYTPFFSNSSSAMTFAVDSVMI